MEPPSEGVSVQQVPASIEAYSAVGKKIALVMQKADPVEKTGVNTFHKYRYAPIGAYLEAVQKTMAEVGLVLLHSHGKKITVEVVDEAKGRKIYTWPFRFQLVDTDTGHHLDFSVVAMAADNEDKAPGKALSLALKYFIGGTFLIAAEDGEADSGPAGQQASPRKGKSPKKSAKKQEKPAGEPSPKFKKLIEDMHKKLEAATPENYVELVGLCENYLQKWPADQQEKARELIAHHDKRFHQQWDYIQEVKDRILAGEDLQEVMGEANSSTVLWSAPWRERLDDEINLILQEDEEEAA